MKDKKKSYLLALLVVFFWATVPSAFKLSLRYLTVQELLFYSTLVSTLALFIILVAQKKVVLVKSFKPRDYWFSALLGFLNPFFYYLVLFRAYSLLPAQQAQPLNLTWGIWLVLISIPLLKQKIRLLDLLALLICFAGVWVISTEGNLAHLKITHPLGVFLALGSSIIWAFYWVLNVRDRKDPLLRLWVNFCAGLVLISIVVLPGFRVPPLAGVLGAVYVGLFEMGIAFFFWLTALKLAESTVNVTILIYFVPFLAFVFIHLFLGEKILVSSVIGAGLIVLGTLVNKYGEWRRQGKNFP